MPLKGRSLLDLLGHLTLRSLINCILSQLFDRIPMSWGTDQSFQGFQREAAVLCARATRSTTPNMARNIVSHAAVGNVKWMFWGLQCLKHLGYLKQPAKSEYHCIYTTFSPIYTHRELKILCIYCCHRASSWRKWWFYSQAKPLRFQIRLCVNLECRHLPGHFWGHALSAHVCDSIILEFIWFCNSSIYWKTKATAHLTWKESWMFLCGSTHGASVTIEGIPS